MTDKAIPVEKVLHRLRVIARVTIELTSPLSISTGEAGDAADNALVRDANGLPTIPGASIAGMLRGTWEGAKADTRFGFQYRAPNNTTPPAQRSLVRTSWGVIHDQDDRPVDDLRTPAALAKDPVLSAALTPQVRDHVRIGHHGAVDGDGKYTRASVMVGHRFTFELETTGDAAWAWMEELIERLIGPDTRLGGRTRGGLGRFSVVRVTRRAFDLVHDLNAWCERPIKLSDDPVGQSVDVQPVDEQTVKLDLTPTEPWQIGGGDVEVLADLRDTAPDIMPYVEQRVRWHGPTDGKQTGAIGAWELVLPASAIKGALRHRTAFHLACSVDKHEAHLEALFGAVNAREDEGETGSSGHRGHVLIEDVRLPLDPKRLLATTHVSLDRFTGAPLGGHLFEELSVDDGRTVRIEMRIRKCTASEAVADAFERAVEELCGDQLQLGAGAGRGYGYFIGKTPATGWVKDAIAGGPQ